MVGDTSYATWLPPDSWDAVAFTQAVDRTLAAPAATRERLDREDVIWSYVNVEGNLDRQAAGETTALSWEEAEAIADQFAALYAAGRQSTPTPGDRGYLLGREELGYERIVELLLEGRTLYVANRPGGSFVTEDISLACPECPPLVAGTDPEHSVGMFIYEGWGDGTISERPLPEHLNEQHREVYQLLANIVYREVRDAVKATNK